MLKAEKKLTDNGNKLATQTSLQLLPLIMDNIPQAVFWKDKNLVYLGCNRAFAEDAGFASPEEIIGKTDFDMPWKEQAELYRADDRHVMDTGEPKLNYEEPQTTPAGSTIWLSTSKIPVCENGRVVAMLGMYEDITERKQAELDLLLRDRALASSINAVIILDLLTNKPIYANDALLKMTGYTFEEVKQLTLADITGSLAELPKIRAAVEEHGFFAGEEFIQRKDGSFFPATFFTSLIRDAKGQPIAVQSSFFDISEHKQAEVLQQQNERLFRALFEMSPDAVMLLDPYDPSGEWPIVDCNTAACTINGYRREELIGQPVNIVNAPTDKPIERSDYLKQLREKGTVKYEIFHCRKDGTTFPVEVSTTLIKIGDREMLLGIDRDITERKQAEMDLLLRDRALASSLNAVLVAGLDFKPIYVNESFLKMTGYTYEEAMRLAATDLSGYPEGLKQIDEATHSQGFFIGEEPIKRKDGSIFPSDFSTSYITDAQGKPIAIQTTFIDITERKQTEKDLLLRDRALDSSINAVFITDLNSKVIYANDAFLKLSGYTREEALQLSPTALTSDPASLQKVRSAIVTQGFYVGEDIIKRKDGALIPVDYSASAIQDAEGRPIATQASFVDITERKRAEAAIRDDEEKLRAIYEGTNDAIMLLNEKGFFDCNSQTLKIFDFKTKEEFTAVHPSDVSPALQPDGRDSLSASQEHIQTAYRQGYDRFEWIHRRSNGEDFPAEVLLSAFDLGGQQVLQATVRDITERKQLETQIREAFERRGLQVQLSTQVSQSIASAASLEELYERLVTQVKDQFGYYHTQLLRYEPAQDAVVLVTGYGETGAKMLAAGHHMPMGKGLIGTAAATGETVLRSSLESDPDWHPNPLLPETKGEIAVPIKLGDTILGVLDVQSNVAGALGADDQLLLEGLCGQIATAIEDTRLRQEMARQYQTFYLSIRDGIAHIHLDGKIRACNAAMERLVGYTQDELKQMNIFKDLTPPQWNPMVDKILKEKVLTQGYADPYEKEYIRKDGTIVPVELSVYLEKDEQGQPIGYTGFIRDITERKQAEAQLQQEKFFSDSILNGLPGIFYLFDAQGKMLRWNKQYEQMMGFTPEEAASTNAIDAFVEEDKAPTLAAIQRVFVEGQSSVEARFLTKDGRRIPHYLTGLALQLNGQMYLTGIGIDITERKQAEQALRENQQFLQTIMDNIPQSIFWKDSNLTYLGCNSAFAADAGIASPRDILNKTDWDMPWKEQADLYRADDSLVMKSGTPKLNYEEPQTTPDGRTTWLRTSKIPLYNENGKVYAVLGMYEDITQRKETETELQREKSLSDAIINSLPGIFYMFDTEGRLVRWNKNYEHVLGMTAEEVAKSDLATGMAEEDLPALSAAFEKAFTEDTLASIEASMINQSGERLPYYFVGNRVQLGDQVYVLGVGQDITERKLAEAQVQQEKFLSDAIINGLPGIFFLFDAQGKMIRWNKQYEQVLEYATEEVAKLNALDSIADEDKAQTAATIQNAFVEGQGTVEAHVITRSGRRIPYYFVGQRLQLDNQLYIAGTGIDITERKQAEEAVRSSQEQLLNIIDFLPDATLVTDKDRKVIAWNRAIEELTGIKKEEIIGKGDYAYAVPFYGEARPMLVDFAMEHTQVADRYESIQQQGDRISAEVYISSVYQGRGGYLLAIASPLYDADGNIVGAIEAIRDVTERKQLETQIREAFERRGLQVQLSTQISQSIASAASLAELYERVVTQVKDQFGYYHTQLLRYEPAQDAVVLVTGYGETGAKMMTAGHRMPMGEGLIGTAAATGETILRPTLESDPDWHPNPLLPETKGEIAVPIKLGDTILGVLDVQSNVAGALGADDQLLLEGLCGQIATAIEDTRLRQEMAERLEEVNRLYRAMSREGWQAYRAKTDLPSGFVYDQAGLRQIEDAKLAQELFTDIPVTVPGGETIGKMAIADDPQHPITPDDEIFLQQVSEQLALALESARLFEQTQEALSEVQRRASELETVARVSATTSTVLDPDQLLQTVVDLTKERFGLYHAHIFVYEESWNTLLLAAGAGEVGRKLVAEEHAIPLSIEQSLVARAARDRKAIIVNNVESEPGFLPNPLLPETRAEMAIPMTVGDKLLGVFDVQSNKEAGFSDEDASVYVTLASQVGVALQNARLYMEQAALVTQLRELDRLKSSFLANMSHELRTPLNSILGFADVIIEELDGPLTENMSNDLRLIQKNGQHLLHLINDVLDMAKIEAGRMNLNPENFKAFEVLEEVTSITSTLASEKNLALFIKEDSDQDVRIYADRTRLRQVMINLVNNAIKFTETGNIALKLDALPGARVLITVKDTGIGIPPDKLEAVFQEFTQVDSSSTRKAGGTGLGLPISRKLVEMHGGRLWAESTGIPGEGSTFFVELPIEARITETIEKQAK